MERTVPVVINGLGGVIGSLVARCVLMQPDRFPHVHFMGGNAPGKDMAHIWNLIINGHDPRMPRLSSVFTPYDLCLFQEKDAAKIDWASCSHDGLRPVVIDCSDKYRSREKASAHLTAGAEAVILSCPASGECDGTFILGINSEDMNGAMSFISGASCTTIGLASLLAAFDPDDILCVDVWTIHSGTPSDYKTPEGEQRARGNITQATSGATKSIEKIFPGLTGKIRVRCMRVPVDDVSALPTEIYFKPGRGPTSFNEACRAFHQRALIDPTSVVVLPRLEKDQIPKKQTSPHLSGDFVGCTAGFVVDLNVAEFGECLILPGANQLSIGGYYANSFGYAWKLAELIEEFACRRLGL